MNYAPHLQSHEYIPKPVAFRAMQFDGSKESALAIRDWANKGFDPKCALIKPDGTLFVHDENGGQLKVRKYDWVQIKRTANGQSFRIAVWPNQNFVRTFQRAD